MKNALLILSLIASIPAAVNAADYESEVNPIRDVVQVPSKISAEDVKVEYIRIIKGVDRVVNYDPCRSSGDDLINCKDPVGPGVDVVQVQASYRKVDSFASDDSGFEDIEVTLPLAAFRPTDIEAIRSASGYFLDLSGSKHKNNRKLAQSLIKIEESQATRMEDVIDCVGSFGSDDLCTPVKVGQKAVTRKYLTFSAL